MLIFSEVFQRCQYGFESVSGTPVPATAAFGTLMFDIDPNKRASTDVFTQGNMLPVNVVPAKPHTEGSFKGTASTDDLIALLTAGLCIPSAGVFAPFSTQTNVIQTMTIEKGDQESGNAKQIPFCFCNGLDFDITAEKPLDVSGKLMGGYATTGVALTGSIPTNAPNVFFPTEVDVFIATSEAGLAAGQIAEAMSAKVKIDKLKGDVYTLDSRQKSFTGLVTPKPSLSVDFVFVQNDTTDAYLTAIDTSDLYFCEIIARGAGTQSIRLRSPIRFENYGEGTSQDTHTASITGKIQHTDTFNTVGGGLVIEIINA